MTTPTMTKTAARATVAELRREARRITDALTPTPAWIVREIGHEPQSPERRAQIIEDALKNIDGLAAQLREGLSS